MCWSLRVSLASYATVCALSALLWRRNWQTDRWFAAFLAFVGQIQGCEVLLWLDQGCRGTNQAASGALLAVIVLEPLPGSRPHSHRLPARQAAPRCAMGTGSGERGVWRGLGRRGSAAHGRLVLAALHRARLRPAPALGLDDPHQRRLAPGLLRPAGTPVAFMRPVAHAATGAAYAAATFAAAHYLYNTGAAFESMWCWLAVGGYAIPLALCRRPGGRPPRRRAAQRRPARQHAS